MDLAVQENTKRKGAIKTPAKTKVTLAKETKETPAAEPIKKPELSQEELIERAKAWLHRYAELKSDMERYEDELREISISCNTGAITGKKEALEKKIGELNNLIIEKKMRCAETIEEITGAIDRMERSDEKAVLTYRYIMDLGWGDICEKMDKSWKTIVFDIHRKALLNVQIPEHK